MLACIHAFTHQLTVLLAVGLQSHYIKCICGVYAAYPFDQHELGVRVECSDCRLDLHTNLITPFNVSNAWALGIGAAEDAASYDSVSIASDPALQGECVCIYFKIQQIFS